MEGVSFPGQLLRAGLHTGRSHTASHQTFTTSPRRGCTIHVQVRRWEYIKVKELSKVNG